MNERKQIVTDVVPLHNLEQTGFYFSSVEAYLVLLVYRANTKENVEVVSFPHSLWGLVESTENLTPRGLASSISADCAPVQSLDSFLLSKRENKETSKSRNFKYMLFVWNGREANALLKASALTRGFELDTLLNKSGDSVLSFIFNGGVVRGTRLQRGRVLIFDHASSEHKNDEQNDNPNTPETERVIKTFETVYLFQWMVPDIDQQLLKSKSSSSQVPCKSVVEQTMYPKFRKYFFPTDDSAFSGSKRQDEIKEYQKRFKWIDQQHREFEHNSNSGFNSGEVDRAEGDMQIDSNSIPQDVPASFSTLPKSMVQSHQPPQKPAIPILNISAQQKYDIDEPNEKLQTSENTKGSKVGGIALDISQAARKQQFDEYDTSSDRSPEDSPAFPWAQAQNNGKGISLDLTKAKAIQNEILGQGANSIKPLALPGVALQDQKVPSLGIPTNLGSMRSNESDPDARFNLEPSTGPQLKINIKNVTKLKEDVQLKEEEDAYEPPKHRRGRPQPDEPPEEIIDYGQEDSADYMMKNTSVAEARNDRFKQI